MRQGIVFRYPGCVLKRKRVRTLRGVQTHRVKAKRVRMNCGHDADVPWRFRERRSWDCEKCAAAGGEACP